MQETSAPIGSVRSGGLLFYQRGAVWHVRLRREGKRFRISTRQRDFAAAKSWADEHIESSIERLIKAIRRHNRRDAGSLYHSAKNRAKKRGQVFRLTLLDVHEALARAGGYCQVTGIQFSNDKPVGCRRGPFRPSLDRIDRARGYRPDNVRIVCVAANTALGEWGDAVFLVLATRFLGHAQGHNLEAAS